MRLSLRAGEKIYMNGAVFSVDRRVSIELLNDATFLLEAHVMQAEEATSPLRQLYFAIQLMLMEPGRAALMRETVERMFAAYLAAAAGAALCEDVREAREAVRRGRLVDALKRLRRSFATEEKLMGVARVGERERRGEVACR